MSVHQLQYRQLFCLGFDFDGDVEGKPALWKIGEVYEVVMVSGIAVSFGIQRARQVKERLAIPGVQRQLGGFFDTISIGETPVVMNVIDQGDFHVPAHRQQVFGGINAVVVFKGQSAANGFGQTLYFPSKAI